MKNYHPSAPDPDPARTRRNQRLGVQAHILVYVMANLIQVIVWWAYTPEQFFWPLWSIVGWGAGLIFHIWAVRSFSGSDTVRGEQAGT